MNPTLQKLKGKSQVKFMTKDDQFGEMEWTLRPIPFTTLLENLDKFTGIPQQDETAELDENNLTSEQAKKIQTQIYPMMKSILPKCIVEPKVIIGTDAAEDELPIDDIPFNTVSDLFNEIVKITGLDKMGEEARKKLRAQTSVKA